MCLRVYPLTPPKLGQDVEVADILPRASGWGVTLACKAVPSTALDDTVITNALLQFITFALTRSLEVEAPIKEAKGGSGGGDDKPQKRILKMWAKVRKHVQSIVMSAHQVSMQIGGASDAESEIGEPQHEDTMRRSGLVRKIR